MKRFLVLFVAVLLLMGIVTCILPIRDFEIEGENSYYSPNELKEKILEGKSDRALIYFLQEKFTKHRTIPFIEKYTVSFRGFRHVTAQVYEKKVIGFMRFQQYYLYFDWDGTLVESSEMRLPGIFEVTGFDNDHAVLGDKLKVADPDSFSSILTITQFLDSNKLILNGEEVLLADLTQQIHFSQAGVSVIFGDITVLLGSGKDLEAKLSVMCDTLPELYGRKGTLYLDSYKKGEAHPSYIFK